MNLTRFPHSMASMPEHPQFQGKPWISGPLEITQAVAQAIEAHALECYPSECCGFLLGPATNERLVDEARREVNDADRYHALDPLTFPRTSQTYFKMNEMRASRILEEAEAAGRPVKAIYHSHCDAGAYFSEEDTQTFSQAGLLMWPCAFVVVSVVGDGNAGEARERRLWVHVPGEDRFTESELRLQ